MSDNDLTIDVDLRLTNRAKKLMRKLPGRKDTNKDRESTRMLRSSDYDTENIEKAAALAFLSAKDGVVHDYTFGVEAESQGVVKYSLNITFTPPLKHVDSNSD